MLVNRCLAGSSLRCAIRNDPRDARVESLVYGFALEVQRRLGMLRRWVDAFIAPSRHVAAMLELTGVPLTKIHLIRNGVAVDEPLPPGSEFALYAGRLDPSKGVATLLRAAKLAKAPIAIAGAGALAPEVGKAPVHNLGELDPAGIENALRRAAFTIVPSECRENSSYVVAESFAAARATVATRIGGLPETVREGHTGLLVEPGDAHRLAAAIDRLWGEAGLSARLGAEAHKVARSELRLQSQLDRTVDLYSALLGQ